MRVIEQGAKNLLNDTLGECITQRTEAGRAKYGQTLDDNAVPTPERYIHLIQELLDGVQYALWAIDTETAWALAEIANKIQEREGLTAEQIMAGGKR